MSLSGIKDQANQQIPATLREVGKAFGVSTTRADKVINRALLRLRAAA